MKTLLSRTGVPPARAPAQLSALGYPGFAHVPPAQPRSDASTFLLSILVQPDADARLAEALPWLLRQAKLRNLQNRVGFVLEAAGVESPELFADMRELECARLLQESTLGWDSMPAATRQWIRVNRPPLAEHRNGLTTLQTNEVEDAK